MAEFKFKVAYTEDSKKIEPAIDVGTINEGDLIIINEDGVGSMKFITDKKQLIGMDATLSEQEKENIISDTLDEADDRYLSKESTLILNGNTNLGEGTAETVGTASDLASAFADESVTSIALAADIVVDESLVVSEKSLTLDLAGHTLENGTPIWDKDNRVWSVVRVNNATLTLKDSSNTGVIKSPKNDGYAVDLQENGTIYIEGGTYIGNVSAVYIFGANSLCSISGGDFKIQQTSSVGEPYGYVINMYDSVRDSARCTITGGTFEGFDPMYPNEGDTKYLPEGYTTQYDAETNTYTVIKED